MFRLKGRDPGRASPLEWLTTLLTSHRQRHTCAPFLGRLGRIGRSLAEFELGTALAVERSSQDLARTGLKTIVVMAGGCALQANPRVVSRCCRLYHENLPGEAG